MRQSIVNRDGEYTLFYQHTTSHLHVRLKVISDEVGYYYIASEAESLIISNRFSNTLSAYVLRELSLKHNISVFITNSCNIRYAERNLHEEVTLT